MTQMLICDESWIAASAVQHRAPFTFSTLYFQELFICLFTRFVKVYSWYFQNSVTKIFNCPFTSLPTVRSQDFKRSFHDIIIPFTRFSTICLQDSKLYLKDFHMPGYRFFSLSIHKTSKVSFIEFSTVWSQYFEMAVKDF